MSAHIPICLQCLPPCNCAEFYSDGSSLRGPTQLQHLKCDSCGHPWFSHLALDILETDALYPHRRRGLLQSRCQGFVPNLCAVCLLTSRTFVNPLCHLTFLFQTLLMNHWNPHTLCVCGGEWKAHMSYHARPVTCISRLSNRHHSPHCCCQCFSSCSFGVTVGRSPLHSSIV